MDDTIYKKLREHLDSLPAGFPATESGAEIKMLKKFYTPEQAAIAMEFSNMPQSASAAAEKLGMGLAEAEEKIEQMAKEGSLFRIETPEGPVYNQPNYIMGLYEWHVNSIDKEAASYSDDIYDALFDKHWKGRETKQLRIVPVGKSIDTENIVRSYDAIRELVKGTAEGPYAVAPCICRVEQKALGNEVTRPMETCLTFGLVAKYYIQNGIGRELTLDQLMDKLDECEEAALVPFSTNSKKISNMCMCDRDSCQLLRIISKWPKPAEEVHSAFLAHIDQESCTGCGKCVKRCQIDAIKEVPGPEGTKQRRYTIDPDRCIGCGLCVPLCRTGAVTLKGKANLPDVPEDVRDMNVRMAKERIKLGV